MYKTIILMILNLLSFSAVANCNKSNVYESISCYEKELRSSKTLLNQSYKKQYLALDTDGKLILEKSQKAWINYKNSHCDELVAYLATQVQGGGSKLINLSCNTQLTNERIKQLDDLD